MMRHNSLRASLNIYQHEAKRPIKYKYSPNYRKTQAKNFQVLIKNPNLAKTTNKVQKKQRNTAGSIKKFCYHSEYNPQKLKGNKQHKLDELKMTLSSRLEDQASRFKELRASSRQKQWLFNQERKVMERIRSQQKERVFQQIQYKYNEDKRQKEVKLRRKTSETSFILQTHKETIEMMKESRQVRSRSEIKMTRQQQRQTEKDHEFLVAKNKTNYLQNNFEQKYHKAFLKNTPMPKTKYPNLNDLLAVASKALSMNVKKSQEYKQEQKKGTKRQPSRKKFQAIHPKSTHKHSLKSQHQLEKQLIEAKKGMGLKKVQSIQETKEPQTKAQTPKPEKKEAQPSPFLTSQPESESAPVQPQPEQTPQKGQEKHEQKEKQKSQKGQYKSQQKGQQKGEKVQKDQQKGEEVQRGQKGQQKVGVVQQNDNRQ